MADDLNIHRQRAMERMTEEEYRQAYEAKQKELDESSEKTKKIVFTVMGIIGVSIAAAIITSVVTLGGEGESVSFIWLVILPIILSVFLFDPKLEEDKRSRYETDRFILMQSLENKLKLNKIRQIGVIVMGALFGIIEGFVWYFIITIVYYE